MYNSTETVITNALDWEILSLYNLRIQFSKLNLIESSSICSSLIVPLIIVE